MIQITADKAFERRNYKDMDHKDHMMAREPDVTLTLEDGGGGGRWGGGFMMQDDTGKGANGAGRGGGGRINGVGAL